MAKSRPVPPVKAKPHAAKQFWQSEEGKKLGAAKRMTRSPIAYLRRSNPDTRNGGGDLSREQQLEAVKRMASEDGHHPDALIILEGDWGKSGRDAKLADRHDWASLLAKIERDEVTHLYLYELNRAGRSVLQVARLAALAREHKVSIRCSVGISPANSPEGAMMTNVLASIDEFYGSKASERAQANVASRQARGDDLGPPAYGLMRGPDGKHVPNPAEAVGAVLNAYDRAGSFLGAAKLLTAEGRVQPRRADHWDGSTVARVVRAHRHVGKVEQGVKQRAAWRLFRLLRCPHCGRTLTAQASPPNAVTYLCKNAVQDPRHPRPYSVSEGKVMPWVMAEIDDHLRVPYDNLEVGVAADARRAALEAKREEMGWALVNGVVTDREAVQRQQAAIDAELAKLDYAEEIIAIPDIDWTATPDKVNAFLRAMWDHVQLDQHMVPVAARWREPEWRS